MKLTNEQVNFFNTFGYLVIRKLFDEEEIATISEGFEWSIKNVGGGKEHDGSSRTMFAGPIEHTTEMSAILDHPGILGLLGGVIGEDFNYCGGDGNYYTGDTRWHPDGNWGQLWAVKIAFYLDELTKDTGCLRVIPRSQRPDHLIRKEKIDPNESMELFGVHPKDFPGNVPLETNPGDIAIFNHDTYHAAFGGGQWRKMFTMNCTRHAKTAEDMELANRYLSMHSPGGNNLLTGAGMYYPAMMDTASEDRRAHLEQPIQIHDELFPHLARANTDRFKIVGHEVSTLQPAAADISDVPESPDHVEFGPAPEDVLKIIGNKGRLDIQRSHDGQDGLVYARTTLILKEACPLTVSYGVDAPAKVWINGKEADVRHNAPERLRMCEFQAIGEGVEGTNTVLFAILTNQGKATGVIPSFLTT